MGKRTTREICKCFCGVSDIGCRGSGAGTCGKMDAYLPGTIAYGVAQPAESSCGIPDQPADLPGITSAKFWHEDRCGLSGKADDNLSVRSGEDWKKYLCIVQKAVFSEEEISQEEARFCYRLYRKYRNRRILGK